MFCEIALVLLLDASTSLSMQDWRQQVQQTANAIRSEEVINAIERAGPIAIRPIAFSDTPVPMLEWHVLRTRQDAQELAAALDATSRPLWGGTCAATRLPTLAFILGFRRFEFYGFDFYYPEDTKQEDIKQQLMVIGIGNSGRHFTTTGELVAAMQDLGVWDKWMVENKLTVTWHGDGAGAEIWKSLVHNYDPPKEYIF